MREYPGRISLLDLPIVVGRDRHSQLYLPDVSVSRRHAVLLRRGSQVCVVDQDSSYGTYVNGVRVQEWPLRSGDTVRFGLDATFVFGHGELMRIRKRGMFLEVRSVKIAVGRRVLVDGVSFSIPQGRNVGILGPSGTGKTMLLRCLSGVRKPAQGIISTDQQADIWDDIALHQSRLAFVPQQDIVYPLLTVEENVRFAAVLRADPAIRDSLMGERVSEVIELVGLRDHSRKRVHVLSGGQRKRAHVAMELLCEPDLLLLDEPTAGLDPGNETHWMEQQRLLARQGSTVICSTHLMENIRLFDWVIVLGRKEGAGCLAYQGPPEHLLEALDCRLFADLYEKLEAGQFNPRDGHLGSEWCDHRSSVPVQVTSGLPESSPGTREERVGLLWVDQCCVVYRRTALNFWRDRGLKRNTFVQPVVLAVFLVAIQFNPGRITSVLFLSLVIGCWLGANNAIRELVRDRRYFVRDKLSGMQPDAYLAAKVGFLCTVGVIQLAILLTVIRKGLLFTMPEQLLERLHENVAVSFWFFVLLLVYLGGGGMALVASTLCDTEEAAVSWLPLLLLPQILVSAVATGVSSFAYHDARPFRPLVITLSKPFTEWPDPERPLDDPDRLSTLALTVDGVSFGVLTRPALLAIDPDSQNRELQIRGISRWVYIADLLHLIFLVAVIHLGVWAIFSQRQQRWPWEVGY